MKFLMNSRQFFLNENDQMTITNNLGGKKQLIIVPPMGRIDVDPDAIRVDQQRLADEVELVCDQTDGPLEPGRYVSRDLVLTFDKHGANLKLKKVERNQRWKKGVSALDYPKGPEPVRTDGRSRYKKDWQGPEQNPEPLRDPEVTKRAIQARLKPHLREASALLKEHLNKNNHLIEVIPNKYVYHTSNSIFRDKISKEGLIPQGKSESWLSDTKIDGKVIFAINSNKKEDIWDSGYDDDLYRINTTNLKNKWYYDPNFVTGIYASDEKDAIITFEPIPINSIELIYKGSGENLDDLEKHYYQIIKRINL